MKSLTRRTVTVLAATALTVGGLAGTALASPAERDFVVAAPAADDPALTNVYVWATNVNLREWPNTRSNILAVRSQYWLDAVCQTRGETVTDPAVGTNHWWTQVMELSGSDVAWVNNLYLRGGQKIAGVPGC
ncbi:peptidase M23 [Streptomyces sp. NEAU-W12]|uniref:peptidase M23 n=1 Tax=Streptomyces sp. NEAU-W12 TaxID=2994668 RepID=UPI00224A492A|nr:peptidase M23 [Streptomyces sp. NEAU-W12]MCX2923408.1 peptidase M23 [Streptomyces sp. NEAU-W12]